MRKELRPKADIFMVFMEMIGRIFIGIVALYVLATEVALESLMSAVGILIMLWMVNPIFEYLRDKSNLERTKEK